jgi:hypothetical protein
MKKTYKGACHCGAVQFEADIDLAAAGTFKCNCSICTKTRMWGTIVAPQDFRLISGEADLQDYQPYGVHHVFCKHCGVRPYGWGEHPDLGGKFYGLRLACLEGVEDSELANARVTYHDGRNDNYAVAPTETRHL